MSRMRRMPVYHDRPRGSTVTHVWMYDHDLLMVKSYIPDLMFGVDPHASFSNMRVVR